MNTHLGRSMMCILLAGCVSSASNTQIQSVLTSLGNTLVSDLNMQRAVALAATPPDTDGAQCAGTAPNPTVPGDTGTGAIAVATAVQRLMAVTGPTTPGGAAPAVGAFTVAEIATIFQPGSAQYNWAVKTLETACIAKVHDVNQAINSTAGIIGAIPSILVLAAAPVGM